MLLKTRRVIFYSLIAVFCVSGTGLIFYSNGWRLDLETFRVNQLGGLFIEVAAPDVKIQVGKNNFNPETGFFRYSSLITDLFPKTYAVSVSKDGYQLWKKELAVKPSLITKVYPVILIPQNPKQELVLKNMEDFWVGPKHWAIVQASRLLIDGSPALGREIVSWSASGNKAITFSPATKNYYLVDIAKNNTALNLAYLLRNYKNEKLIDARFYPQEDHRLILTSSGGLYALDAVRLTISSMTDEKAQSLFKGKLSPDGEKLAFLDVKSGNKIKVIFLETSEEFGKAKGESVILETGFSEAPQNFDWDQTSSYLFIQYGNTLYFSDIDERSPLNLQLVSDKVRKYQYQLAADSLYILSTSPAGLVYKLDLK